MKKILITGAGGFIGSHMVSKMKSLGHWVRGVDLKYPEFSKSKADEFIIGDLTDQSVASKVFFSPTQTSMDDDINSFDEVYCFASWMGGAGVIFTGDNDADILRNSILIDINSAHAGSRNRVKKLFFSSSACCYNHDLQKGTNNIGLKESDAYPANPDSDYGFGKLTSERVYQAYHRNYGLNIRIARFHNIFGPEGTWQGGKEKAPAAICRKVSEAISEVEVWGDGRQTRSFLYIDECIEGVRRLMASDVTDPLNIGSDEMVSINQLAAMTIQISRKELEITHVEGPQGVRGRNSNNDLIKLHLGWSPSAKLYDGLKKTFDWINKQVHHG